MSDLTELRCFNPVTGKRDGGYCVWEGKGKCLKCEAAERIEELEAERDKLLEEGSTLAAGQCCVDGMLRGDDRGYQYCELQKENKRLHIEVEDRGERRVK